MTDTEPSAAVPEHPKKISLSLLDNAYDSLNASLERAELSVVDPRAWKLAIFLLVHALELLMKERLRRDHRLLVFSNVDKPSHTVSMEVALSRLQAVGVAIEAADASAIRQAIEWRDKIAHYEFELVTEELEQSTPSYSSSPTASTSANSGPSSILTSPRRTGRRKRS